MSILKLEGSMYEFSLQNVIPMFVVYYHGMKNSITFHTRNSKHESKFVYFLKKYLTNYARDRN